MLASPGASPWISFSADVDRSVTAGHSVIREETVSGTSLAQQGELRMVLDRSKLVTCAQLLHPSLINALPCAQVLCTTSP